VSDKSERRAARSAVAEYHQAELGSLLARVAEAVDRYREGELDAFDVDQVLFQYSRAAKELWKYCNLGQVEITAAIIREQPPHDWWERGAPAFTGRCGPTSSMLPTAVPAVRDSLQVVVDASVMVGGIGAHRLTTWARIVDSV
jgi:hypothetical protein